MKYLSALSVMAMSICLISCGDRASEKHTGNDESLRDVKIKAADGNIEASQKLANMYSLSNDIDGKIYGNTRLYILGDIDAIEDQAEIMGVIAKRYPLDSPDRLLFLTDKHRMLEFYIRSGGSNSIAVRRTLAATEIEIQQSRRALQGRSQ